ncbi:MAG TPA: tRNA uridine-5-carboxymethylaminomethyl(34) synthesis GTPase MnmE [Rhizobiaceae bacterium]|nr:tRNA uridine-5-carboxymethylaminomethyl(34) synthesis GTPase MnmE [Rhizobiaceae bacterium]
MSPTDTIFALSSGSLPSGVAVLRVSGTQVDAILNALVPGKSVKVRDMALRRIVARDGTLIDHGLILRFAAPASFTGEDVAELHLHGGRATVNALLRELGTFPATRHAEAGEFTRRAFINGKLDLTAAEALSDLIAAETEMQRRFALQRADGVQARLFADWRARLVHLRSLIEAAIDFSDEGDVSDAALERAYAALDELAADMDRHLTASRPAEIIRDGLRVAIIGAPNAGKSSLLNHLAGREVAIVTDEAGTTRDVLEVQLDLNGYKIVLFDTAGLRDSDSVPEQIGIARAREIAASAHVVLYLIDGSASGADFEIPQDTAVLRVASKADIAASKIPADLSISVRTGDGISQLIVRLTEIAAQAGDAMIPTAPASERQLHLLRRVHAELGSAKLAPEAELAAEHLRLAADALGRMTGEIGTEEVLGAIFANFCVGK